MTEKAEKADMVDYSKDPSQVQPDEAGAHGNAQDDFEKAAMTLKLWGLTVFCMLGSFSYGFTASIIASSLEQPNFAVAFDYIAQGSNITNLIGMIVGMFNVGGMIGPVALCYIQDRFGRKMGFAFAFGCVGLRSCMVNAERGFTTLSQVTDCALQAGAMNFGMFAAVAALLCSFVYVGEVAPASRRGMMGGLMSPGVNSGYVLAAFIGLGFYYDSSLLNWRIPLIFQIFWPVIGITCLWFVPESPRWLAMQGRKEESMAVLHSIHRHSSDPTNNVARAESYQINAQSDFDKTQPSSWRAMLVGKYKKRSAIVMLLWMSNMLTGIEVPINFGPTICASLGFSTPVALTFGLALLLMAVTVATLVASVNDRLGRRKWILMETMGCAVAMSIIAGLSAHFDATSPDAIKIGGPILMAFLLFMFFYSMGEPALYTYTGEIFPSHVRVKGVALGFVSLNAFAVWILFVQPTASVTIGWRFYLVFACGSVACSALIYFFVPEVRRVPLEEINRCFGEDEDVAVHASDIVFENGEIKRLGQ
ncbi:hypothetical protein RQP46_010430 [Phenoliferia psychrophenolica]